MLGILDLPETHSEADLQAGLLLNLRKVLMELGDGFAFVGEKVRVQVGNQDFEIDLLFYHRDLQYLVAYELKTGRWEHHASRSRLSLLLHLGLPSVLLIPRTRM